MTWISGPCLDEPFEVDAELLGQHERRIAEWEAEIDRRLAHAEDRENCGRCAEREQLPPLR